MTGYIIKNSENIFVCNTFSIMQSSAINKIVEMTGKSWTRLVHEGNKCVNVELIEI